MSRDSKSVMASLVYEVNQLFLLINSYIANNREKIDKFDDLIEVIYAKKHRFIGNKTHLLSDRYELYLGLKDDINYLSDYTEEEFDLTESYASIDQMFAFEFRIKPRMKGLRFIAIVFTLGIALGFLEESTPL